MAVQQFAWVIGIGWSGVNSRVLSGSVFIEWLDKMSGLY